MKDLPYDCEILFKDNQPDEAAKRIEFALDCLLDDETRSFKDYVAEALDYELLIAALFCAKKKIIELEEEVVCLEEDNARLRESRDNTEV